MLNSYWSQPTSGLLTQLQSTDRGLSSGDAAARLKQVGPNRLKAARRASALGLLLNQFKSPLVLILIVATIISAFVGEYTDAPMAIDMTASLDPQTGRIEWRLRAIDTATGLPPEDPLAGFLPPEDDTGRGQGHVSYLIKPEANVELGTRITNTASIVFDTNDPITTNEVWNTIGIPGYRLFLPLVLKNH